MSRLPGICMFILFSLLIVLTGCGQTENVDNTVQTVKNEGIVFSKEPIEYQEDEPQEEEDAFVIEKGERQEIRGIYLNRTAIKNIDEYIEIIKSSDQLNAVVMDIKDDYGRLTYQSDVETVNEIQSDEGAVIDDLDSFVQRLKDEGIYTIARVVVFKDPFLAENKSEWALESKDGSVWIGPSDIKWIDPYKNETWEYVMDIVEEVTLSGMDEIQYDYIRFPENAKKVDAEVQYANTDDLEKDDLIEQFLQYSKERLSNYPVFVSADVFGLVTTANDHNGIGQLWEKMSPYLDFISPMIYPSHYAKNSYGLSDPNDHPYELIKHAMTDAIERNDQLESEGIEVATIRPWLQDFDYRRDYTKEDVDQQIQALHDLGVNEYLLWNAASKYTK